VDPVFIHIFGRPIYWYGVMTALGFLAAVLHWSWLGKRQGYPAGLASEIGIWVMVSGIVGARLAYVIANLPDYAGDPLQIIRIDRGGLIYYGGFIGAFLGICYLAHRKNEPLWRLGDFVITAVPLGHAIGRVGCFLNGCCFGKACDLPWAVGHNHPTPIYETIFNVVLYLFLVGFHGRKKRDGTVVAMYLLLYPIGRFFFEMTRGDDRMKWMGLTVAQEISVFLLLLGCLLWAFLPRHREPIDG